VAVDGVRAVLPMLLIPLNNIVLFPFLRRLGFEVKGLRAPVAVEATS
jgi:hypothetical protein